MIKLNELKQEHDSYYLKMKAKGYSDSQINEISDNGLLINIKDSKNGEIRQFNYSNKHNVLRRKLFREWIKKDFIVEKIIDEDSFYLIEKYIF